LIGSRNVPKLAPGQELTGTKLVRIPHDVSPGTYFVLACADSKNVVTERDETNNCRASTTQVRVEHKFKHSGKQR
jgi:hypothetical protein